MKKLKDMISVEHKPGDPPMQTDTDWEAVNTLTAEEIRADALADADAQPIPRGSSEELAKLGLTRIVNVKSSASVLA